MDSTLRGRTLTGVTWSAISQGLNQAFNFAISIVLARILGPKVYGLIGMIWVFTGFAAVFGDLGLASAIIQRKELEARHLDAAFWTNVIMGTTMTLLMAALAPVVAWFYKEPMLLSLTAVIALKYVVDSLCVVQMALLNRAMRFQKLAWIQIGSCVISGLVGLGFALYGMGPWSLVAQTLGASVATMAVCWCLEKWRPRFSYELKACKDLFGFSAPILGFNIVNYWARTFDNLLIGRFIGASALGIYTRAYTLMLMPLSQVSQVVGRVMFPALSSIQDDKSRVKHAYLKSTSIIGLITFPMMIGAFAISEHFILALLGEKWAEVIPLFRIFCWVGLLQSIGTTVGWIYQSQGRTGLFFTMGMIITPLIVLAFIIGLRWGIIGIAWSYFIVTTIWMYPSFAVPGRLINLTFFEIIRRLYPAFICASAMGIVLWVIDFLLPVAMAHWKYLAIQIPFGVIVYGSFVVLFKLDSWQEGRRAFSDMVGKHME